MSVRMLLKFILLEN